MANTRNQEGKPEEEKDTIIVLPRDKNPGWFKPVHPFGTPTDPEDTTPYPKGVNAQNSQHPERVERRKKYGE